jgi:hypothetical protein
MNYLESLIIQHRRKGIVVDTNLLLLFLIGSFDKEYIYKFKRTQSYAIKDFEILSYFLNNFIIIINPNIITEITNLSDNLNKQTDYKLFHFFKSTLSSCTESYCKTSTVMNNNAFLKFGLTDSTVYDLADKGFLVLTDDFPLYGYLINTGKTVINFNHIRSEYLLN